MTTLVIPVINRPDLLREACASVDVDWPLLLIDNSPDGSMGPVAEFSYPGRVHVLDMPQNLGVAASWNLGIRSTDGPWVIANADVAFGPGDLRRLEAQMDIDPASVHRLFQWAAFGITSQVVDRVGTFDENFHPIYFEDCDYERRCALLDVAIKDHPTQTTHVGSVSINGDARHDNGRTYNANQEFYRAKWGGGARGGEAFNHPFNEEAVPVWSWRLSTSRLASQRWRP